MTRSGISLIIAALLLQAPATRAAQLDKDSCAKLKTEQAQLEQGGTRASLNRGPEWAKANLAADKLEQIRRLIELDEQLLFRCGGKPLVVIPHDPDPAAGNVESKDGAAKGGPAAKAAKTPKADKKQALPVKKASAPPAKTPPQPEAASTQAKGAEEKEKKAAAPPVDLPAKAMPPSQMAPQTATVPTSAPTSAPAPAAAPAPAPTEEKKASAAPAKEAARELAPAKAAPQSEAAPAPSKEDADRKAAAAKAAQAKAKAKKKANDAYSPNPVEWFSNQFGGAPAPKK